MNDHRKKKENRIFDTYVGGKNRSGVYQQIINQIRPHDVFMELFAGSGAVTQYKKPAPLGTIVNDIDTAVFQKWRQECGKFTGCVPSGMDAVKLLKDFYFQPDIQYCIYLDPPYPLTSRKSDKKVYKFEMTDDQHRELLNVVLQIAQQHGNVDFLISTYENPIYSEMLTGWSLHKFQAGTRRGVATECLYMNYRNDAGVLHQYDYLGVDYIDRQRIKRKIDGKVKQLLNLPATERQAIIQAIASLQ